MEVSRRRPMGVLGESYWSPVVFPWDFHGVLIELWRFRATTIVLPCGMYGPSIGLPRDSRGSKVSP